MAHRDLKPDNILIEEQFGSIHSLDFKVKIIDFGFSVDMNSQKKLRTFCGTPSYMAPEIVCKKEYCGKETDIWALGIILFNMVYGRCPFRGENERDLYRKISKGVFSFPDESYWNMDEFRGMQISPQFKALVKRILEVRPEKRPTCEQILKDEWLKGVFF